MKKRRIFVEFDNDCVKVNNETLIINERFLGSRLDALYGLLVMHLLDYKFYHDHINDIYPDITLVKEKVNELVKIYPEFHLHVAAWSDDKSYIDVPDNHEIIKQTFLIAGEFIEIEDIKVVNKSIDNTTDNSEQLYKNLREYCEKLNDNLYDLKRQKDIIEIEMRKLTPEIEAIEALLRIKNNNKVKKE